MDGLNKTIEERLTDCLDRNGIEKLSTTIEYDSLSFITAIVDIENEFGITFPDELLTFESFGSFEILLSIVNNLMILNEVNEHHA